jgi:hypothetical protein
MMPVDEYATLSRADRLQRELSMRYRRRRFLRTVLALCVLLTTSMGNAGEIRFTFGITRTLDACEDTGTRIRYRTDNQWYEIPKGDVQEIIGLTCTTHTGPVEPAREQLSLVVPPEWEVGNQGGQKGTRIVEFVAGGETMNNWTQLLTVQTFDRSLGSLPEAPHLMMNALRTSMERRCPGVVWNIVKQEEGSLLYEWRIANCGSSPDQHEVARILYGKWNVWRLAVTGKVRQLSPDTRSRWIGWLSAASVQPLQP